MIIWLQGPSGGGKTTVGRLLAVRLGLPFLDIDEEIERTEGRTIVDIFSEEGEAGFRRLEWNTLLASIGDDRASRVVALGGGSLADASIREMVRSTGVRLFLDVDGATALARLERDTPRPLLFEEDPLAAWHRLYRGRVHHYRDADIIVDGMGDPVEVVVEIVAELDAIRSATWRVDAVIEGSRTRVAGYRSVWVALQELATLRRGHDSVVVIDADLLPLYGDRIAGDIVPVDSGEQKKSLASVERLAVALASRGMTRQGMLVAVGGGVVTDLVGFAASIYMRGIDVVYVPTTLLGQVDAAIGGKTAVNAGGVRNLLGTVRQPGEVIVCSGFLRTLSSRELKSGFVESLKMGIANSSELMQVVDDALASILEGEIPRNIDRVIEQSIRTKLDVVIRDVEDRSVRHSLNLGHTFGHALESIHPGAYAHGEAVAFGLAASAELAHAMGRISSERRDHISSRAAHFTRQPDTPLDPRALIAAMRSDKKRLGDGLRFVTPTEECGTDVVTVTENLMVEEAIQRTTRLIAGHHPLLNAGDEI